VVLWAFGLSFDQRVFDLLRLDAGSPLAPIAAGISGFTGFAVLGPVALAAAIWLVWRQRYRAALWLILVILTGRLAVESMKLAFQTPRPPEPGQLAVVTSWSFPSGHSAGSMVTFLALAMIAGAHQRSLLPLAIAMAGLVGWSRMALGVHWPSDVAAGLGFGMLWAGAARGWLFKARLPSS